MTNHTHRNMKLAMIVPIAFAALLTVSCSTISSSPKRVDSANPSVTYEYKSDDQLIEANRQAITYCDQFGFFPRVQSFGKDANGNSTVIFECSGTTLAAPSADQTNSLLTYTYTTDAELLDASRKAQDYCVNHGSPKMDFTIVSNSNLSKTVTFRCSAT